MPSLAGKVCLVTGGASGLGLAIVNLLLESKSKVGILDLAIENIEQSLADKDGNALALKCDVTNEAEVEESIAKVTKELGNIFALINNVGILFSAPLVSFGSSGIAKHDSSKWHQVLSTNLTSTFYASKHVAANMLESRTKGVIVNISSVAARGNIGQSAYSASKAGIEALTKVWAKELSPVGIRCFAVAPGFCDTDSTHQAISANILEEMVGRIPLRRLGKPHEIASMVVAGIENDFFNGKVIEVDGGMVV